MAEKVTKELIVTNKNGIHARPAALFVKVAGKYRSHITVEKDGEQINGKSIMGLMMLAAGQGSRLTIIAEGDDAAEAVRSLEELFAKKFNEE
jgi:phosphocarrier protein